MTNKQKMIAWVTILGAGIGASLTASLNFFSEHTAVITAAGGLISAIVAFVVTKKTS